jgi:hypothetical protein
MVVKVKLCCTMTFQPLFVQLFVQHLYLGAPFKWKKPEVTGVTAVTDVLITLIFCGILPKLN